jgi:hypothetical protein
VHRCSAQSSPSFSAHFPPVRFNPSTNPAASTSDRQRPSGKASANFMEIHMSYLFALLHKLVPNFDEANLPLDSDYSYEARQSEDRRLRKFGANIVWFRL